MSTGTLGLSTYVLLFIINAAESGPIVLSVTANVVPLSTIVLLLGTAKLVIW